jgi:glycosyltransferase involved in cell wall biosynthesis
MASPATSNVPAARLADWPWKVADTADMGQMSHLVDWPKITVVTPTLNQGRFLEAAIRSVLLQQYPNLEYIILDGGSTDDSIDIIRHYEGHVAHWDSTLDNGPASAINRGFSLATGEILAWLNSDDLYLPGALHAAAATFRENPHACLVYGEGWYINESGERVEPCRFIRRQFNRRYMVNKDPILQPAAFWRRSLWESTGVLDESLHWVFDWEWLIRAHEQGSFHYLPENLAYYRIQPAALTRTGGLARQLEHGRVTRRYGAWWHPNHVVQQTRRLDAVGRRFTSRWPRFPAAVARWPFALPRYLSEWLLHGMYMR